MQRFPLNINCNNGHWLNQQFSYIGQTLIQQQKSTSLRSFIPLRKFTTSINCCSICRNWNRANFTTCPYWILGFGEFQHKMIRFLLELKLKKNTFIRSLNPIFANIYNHKGDHMMPSANENWLCIEGNPTRGAIPVPFLSGVR